MKCPKCKGKLITKDTRHNDDAEETYRRKVCSKCGHTIFTIEYETLASTSFKSQWGRCDRTVKHRHKK